MRLGRDDLKRMLARLPEETCGGRSGRATRSSSDDTITDAIAYIRKEPRHRSPWLDPAACNR